MTDEEREQEIQRRLRLGYHRVVSGDPDDGYVGEVVELPGCYTAGETPEQAFAYLEEAMAAWLESSLRSGDRIPEPARAVVVA